MRLSDEDIIRLWQDPARGLTGIEAFAREHNLDSERVRRVLHSDDAYTLNKKVTRRFDRRPVRVERVDQQWVADLVDLQQHAEDNAGFRFLLVIVDVASRYAFVRPLVDKRADTVAEAFEDVIASSGRVPESLQVDRGSEFRASFSKAAREYSIRLFSTNTTMKAAIAEAFNRTLKRRLSLLWSARGTYKYHDVIQDIVAHYNRTPHSLTGYAPENVTNEILETVINPALDLEEAELAKRPKFEVDDWVRVTRSPHTFKRQTDDTFEYMPYQIATIESTAPPTYRVKEQLPERAGQPKETRVLPELFYEAELVKIEGDVENRPRKLERIVRRGAKGTRNEGKVLVKWLGYPDEYNSWEPESAIVDIDDSD